MLAESFEIGGVKFGTYGHREDEGPRQDSRVPDRYLPICSYFTFMFLALIPTEANEGS